MTAVRGDGRKSVGMSVRVFEDVTAFHWYRRFCSTVGCCDVQSYGTQQQLRRRTIEGSSRSALSSCTRTTDGRSHKQILVDQSWRYAAEIFIPCATKAILLGLQYSWYINNQLLSLCPRMGDPLHVTYDSKKYTGLDNAGSSPRVARFRVFVQPSRPATPGQAPREHHGVHLQLQRSTLVARPGERPASTMMLD